MSASFEMFLTPGLQHCALEILSYLSPEDLKNCSLVSKTCNDFIFKQHVSEFHNLIEKLRQNPRFSKRYPGWIEVFEYFENLGDYYKLCVFKEGTVSDDTSTMVKPDGRMTIFYRHPIYIAIIGQVSHLHLLFIFCPLDRKIRSF